MNVKAILSRLQELYNRPEVQNGFSSKEKCLSWASSIAPLLKFNDNYYANFMSGLHHLTVTMTATGATAGWQLMTTQVEMAIAELQHNEAMIFENTTQSKLGLPEKRYVDPQRIDELKSLDNVSFDFSKLIALLEELNYCHAKLCVFSIAALMRIIVDHVPPIFGFGTFSEVANNYSGGRSFKKSLKNLDESLRNIADRHIHTQIRSQEALPSFAQVDFSNDLDVLLEEIIRIQKPISSTINTSSSTNCTK